MAKTRIVRPVNNINFTTYDLESVYPCDDDWRPQITDYMEVSPKVLYLVYPNGVVQRHLTEQATQAGVLALPDCKVPFTANSLCVKTLLHTGKYKVSVHGDACHVYTPTKFKQVVVEAGRKSLSKQLKLVKAKLDEARARQKLAETLTKQFSRGL